MTKEEIVKVFALCKLNPPSTPKELEEFVSDFNTILDFFSVLSEADTTNVTELAQVHELSNIFRKDMITHCEDSEENIDCAAKMALINAPDQEESYFKVPLVVDG
jgi:aspartyl/glutamyl-tRNA(Asn/Gln) amidotransferase C subunit